MGLNSLSEASNLDLLTLRSRDLEIQLGERIANGLTILNVCRDAHERNISFKVHLAKFGISSALRELDNLRQLISIDEFVSIGSYLSNAVGDYLKQGEFLNMAPEYKLGWIERERIRNLIARNLTEDALERAKILQKLKPDFYSDFCADIYWQLNEWGMVNEIKHLCTVAAAPAIRCASYSLSLGALKLAPTIYSVYNPYTTNQIILQEGLLKRAGFRTRRALGIPADRLPESVYRLLSGSSRGILGAALAHLKTIEDFVVSGEPYCVITESDAFLTRRIDFSNMVRLFENGDYDFVLCADRHTHPIDDIPVSEEITNFEFAGKASGFDGYALTRRCGLAILKAFASPLYKNHIDGEIIRWLCQSSGFRVGVATTPYFGQSHLSKFSTRIKIELDY